MSERALLYAVDDPRIKAHADVGAIYHAHTLKLLDNRMPQREKIFPLLRSQHRLSQDLYGSSRTWQIIRRKAKAWEVTMSASMSVPTS